MKLKNKKQFSPSGLFCNATTFARVRAFQVAKKQRTEKTTKEGIFMKKWLLTCSIDAIDINFETVLFSEEEPGFWTCEEIAQANRCDFWTVCEL